LSASYTPWEHELVRALKLVRDLRLQAVIQDIDPRALRVALKYIMIVDDHLSKEHGLTERQDHELTGIAEKLFRETPKNQIRKVGF